MNKLQCYLWNWIEFVPFLPYSAEMFTVDIWGKSQGIYVIFIIILFFPLSQKKGNCLYFRLEWPRLPAFKTLVNVTMQCYAPLIYANIRLKHSNILSNFSRQCSAAFITHHNLYMKVLVFFLPLECLQTFTVLRKVPMLSILWAKLILTAGPFF